MNQIIAMSPLDAVWLIQESAETPMHVASLQVFEKPADAPSTYLRDLVARWRTGPRFAAPFNYRLRGGIGLPRWQVLADDQIDIDYHLRHTALPAPGGERELGAVVSRLHSTRLHRRYPLWECHLIEGLHGDHWALYTKVHHSLMDGMAALRIASRCLSTSPEDREMLPIWSIGTDGPDQSRVRHSGRAPVAKSPSEPSASPRAIGATREVAGSLARTAVRSLTGHGAAPFRNPTTAFNTRLSTPRRVATQQYELDRLRSVAEMTGASRNDVFLATCGAAMRRYLLEQDQLPERSLTALIPAAVRRSGAGSGNSITFMFTPLGTDVADPLDRLAAIAAASGQSKRELPRVGPRAMGAYTGLLMAPSLAQTLLPLGGRTPAPANLVLSNVPGMPQPRYLDGSSLKAFYPVSVLLHGQALNITAVGGASTFDIGFTGGRDSVPHLQRIAVYCGEGLCELEDAIAARR
ncbi:MAG: wax ester/triacylglycerol synthase family O-acyltransferase [Propionibacteriales bacterium]|nr:wax ester/triacylglycerol synthase family O-acyltransferase [Propionibacteriales bacterium]